jgi:hypothetical protein
MPPKKKTKRVPPPPPKPPASKAKASKSGTGTSLVRTVGPMVPLAIALLGSAVLPGGKVTGPTSHIGPSAKVEAVKCDEGVEDFRSCHSEYPTGCSSTGKYDPYLNLMKNQTEWKSTKPTKVFTSLQEVLDLEAQIPPDLGKSNHGDMLPQLQALGEGQIHGVVGYLYDIKVEGKESSNCQLDDDAEDQNVDFHIFIGFDPDIAEKIKTHKALTAAEKKQVTQESMIVEMTPHYRDVNDPEWTAAAVKAVKGEQVRVYGQLMVDNEHYVSGQDCSKKPRTAACWRASVWELHPVTDFQVCDAGNCTATSAGWKPIGDGSEEAGAAPAKGTTTGKK